MFLSRRFTQTIAPLVALALVACGQGTSSVGSGGGSGDYFPRVQFQGNYDGDTVELYIPLARLVVIDTPEIDGDCPKERQLAIAARDFLNDYLTRNYENITVTFRGRDIHGRPLVDIVAGGRNVSELMIESGHARVWRPGVEIDWCAE